MSAPRSRWRPQLRDAARTRSPGPAARGDSPATGSCSSSRVASAYGIPYSRAISLSRPTAGIRVRGRARDHHVDRGESILAEVTRDRADGERLAALRTRHGFRPVAGWVAGEDERAPAGRGRRRRAPTAHAALLARGDPPGEECRQRPHHDEHEDQAWFPASRPLPPCARRRHPPPSRRVP